MDREDWVRALAAELDVPADLDARALLEITREVAHAVERPAGPLTTYLIGRKVAESDDPGALADACERARRLAANWPDRTEAG